MSLKKNIKEKITYAVLSAVFFGFGVFFDFIPGLVNSNDYSEYTITNSMNTFEKSDRESDLHKEIKALKTQKFKLEEKTILCERAISTLEEKVANVENFSSIQIGNDAVDKNSGSALLQKIHQRYSNLQKKSEYIETILQIKERELSQINSQKEHLEEDILDIEIEKLEIEKLEQEMVELQKQIQSKRNTIDGKIKDLNQVDNEKTEVDSLIDRINQVNQ